ncbi:unnamed protein product [Ilex paraguariensis]|uniref:Uncharacterized protein n=1 Tax=Ilex paraguariensis TaxID=185542 RepID=A0ABC8SND1_9AQUA
MGSDFTITGDAYSSTSSNLTLHEASFGFFALCEDMMSAEKVWSLSNFPSGLSHESQCVELLSKNNDLGGVLLPPFDNLKSLEVRTGTCGTSLAQAKNITGNLKAKL